MRKNLLVTVFTFLLATAAFAGNSDGKSILKKSFPVASIKNVSVEVAQGRVQLDGNAVGDATVEVFARPVSGKRSKAGDMVADDYEIKIAEENGTLRVVSKSKKIDDDQLNLRFVISVGKNVGSKIATGAGSVRIEDLSGDQQVATGAGSIKAESVVGKTTLASGVGSIELEQLDGAVVASTGSGSLKLSGLKGQVSVTTGSGSVKASNVDAALTVKSDVGSLHFDRISGLLKGHTGSGSIQLSNVSDDIDVSTGTGSITAKNCAYNKQIKLQSGTGSMHLEQLSGNVDAQTQAGSLSLEDLQGTIVAATGTGSVKATKVNGTLTVKTKTGSLNLADIAGNLDAGNSSGSVVINMVSVADYVKLTKTSTGGVELNLPTAEGYNLKIDGGKIKTLKNFKGSFETGKIDGQIGAGGPAITISTPPDQRIEVNLK